MAGWKCPHCDGSYDGRYRCQDAACRERQTARWEAVRESVMADLRERYNAPVKSWERDARPDVTE